LEFVFWNLEFAFWNLEFVFWNLFFGIYLSHQQVLPAQLFSPDFSKIQAL